MDLKQEFLKEKGEILDIKKPYETAAFVIFAVFFLQQMFYLFLMILSFFDNLKIANVKISDKIVSFRFGNTPNIPIFVGRILNQGSAKIFYIFLAFLFLALWYLLIYIFVWNYCNKHGYAKWTWTALIVFGPTSILQVPTYLIYAIYVFRPYIFRFARRGVDEFKKYDSKYQFEEEKEEVKPKKVVEDMEME